MASAVDIKPLPPQEAIDAFRKKGLAPSFDWRDMWQEEHATAFTVAKGMDVDVLNTIREAVDKAIAEGRTFEDFKAGLQPLLEEKGWWGKREMTDPKTGEVRNAQLGSPRRLRTIYDTNLRSAYQAGRWQRIQATKGAFPFLRYHHTPQEHPRMEHLAWGNQPVILPVGDTWWSTHYPPNGWNCKCWVSQLNARTMQRRGLKVTANPIRFPPKGYRNPRTGQTSMIEGGVEPGFSYNVGEAAASMPLQPQPTEGAGLLRPAPGQEGGGPGSPPQGESEHATAPMPTRPGPPPLPEDVTQAEAEAAFLGTFDLEPSQSRVFFDASGYPLAIGPRMFQTIAGTPVVLSPVQLSELQLAALALARPDEIRWVWAVMADKTIRLVRRYLVRLAVAGVEQEVAVDIAPGSPRTWGFATSAGANPGYRVGAVAWAAAGQ